MISNNSSTSFDGFDLTNRDQLAFAYFRMNPLYRTFYSGVRRMIAEIDNQGSDIDRESRSTSFGDLMFHPKYLSAYGVISNILHHHFGLEHLIDPDSQPSEINNNIWYRELLKPDIKKTPQSFSCAKVESWIDFVHEPFDLEKEVAINRALLKKLTGELSFYEEIGDQRKREEINNQRERLKKRIEEDELLLSSGVKHTDEMSKKDVGEFLGPVAFLKPKATHIKVLLYRSSTSQNTVSALKKHMPELGIEKKVNDRTNYAQTNKKRLLVYQKALEYSEIGLNRFESGDKAGQFDLERENAVISQNGWASKFANRISSDETMSLVRDSSGCIRTTQGWIDDTLIPALKDAQKEVFGGYIKLVTS